jgi:fructose-bisphosphate aldolase class II
MSGAGVTEEMWAAMVDYAKGKEWKSGDYKKLNLPFENRLVSQPREIRERMAKAVEDFAYGMMVNVFNGRDTAALAIDAIVKAGSYDLGPKSGRIENPADWTNEKIAAKAKTLHGSKGPEGNFDD